MEHFGPAFNYYPLCVENLNADQRGHPPQRSVASGITPTSPHHVLGPMTTSARRIIPTTMRGPRSQLPTFRGISFLPFRRFGFAFTPLGVRSSPREPIASSPNAPPRRACISVSQGAASTRCQRRSFLLRRALEAGRRRDPAHVALRFPAATGSLRCRVLNWGKRASSWQPGRSTTRVQPLNPTAYFERAPAAPRLHEMLRGSTSYGGICSSISSCPST